MAWCSATRGSVLSLSPIIMAQAEICTSSPRLLDDMGRRKEESAGKLETTEEGVKRNVTAEAQ